MAGKKRRKNHDSHLTTTNVASDQEFWFGDIPETYSVDPKVVQKASEQAASVILRNRKLSQAFSQPLPGDHDHPAIAMISISDGESAARVIMGSGAGVQAAIRDATERTQPTRDDRWLRIDVVNRAAGEALRWQPGHFGITNNPCHDPLGGTWTLPPHQDPSLFGIAFRRDKWAFMGSQIMSQALVVQMKRQFFVDLPKLFGAIPAHSDEHPLCHLLGKNLQVYAFTTEAFFFELGKPERPLFRGHRMYHNNVPQQDLRTAFVTGAEYLASVIDENGRFIYEYNPAWDRPKEGYNILRHAGSVYSILSEIKLTGNKDLIPATERAMKYLANSARPCPIDVLNPKEVESDDYMCIVEDHQIKLGGNGLSLVAFCRYTEVTGDKQYMELMKGLANWATYLQGNQPQQDSGRLYPHVFHERNGRWEATKYSSEFYDGEMLLGIARLLKLEHDEKLLEVGNQFVDWIVTKRDPPGKRVPHDHWMLYALNDLYRIRPNQHCIQHTIRIANEIAGAQRVPEQQTNNGYHNTHGQQPIDYFGGYPPGVMNTGTATRMEGMSAAYNLMKDTKNNAYTQKYLTSLRWGVRFLVQTTYAPESVMYFRHPERAIGGVPESADIVNIRIDYVQHSISALMETYKIEEKAHGGTDGGAVMEGVEEAEAEDGREAEDAQP